MIEIKTAYDIRKSNLLNLMIYLHKKGDCFRKDLATELGVSMSSITNLCNILEKEKLLVKTNETRSINYSGRTAHLVRLTRDEFYIGILDLNLKKTARFLLMKLNGDIEFEVELKIYESCEQFIDTLYSKVSEELSMRHITGKILSLSVVLSGIYNSETEKVFATNTPAFEGLQLRSMLEEKFQTSVQIENDSNVTALGIALSVEERGIILYLHLDEGIGLGVSMNNFIFSGEHGFAPEVCCMQLGALLKEKHWCGSDDCAEGHLCFAELSKLTGMSDQEEFLEHKGVLLGRLVASLYNIFDCEKFYIGGRGSAFLEKLWPYAEKELSSRILLHEQRDLFISWDLDFLKIQIEGAFYNGISAALHNLEHFGDT